MNVPELRSVEDGLFLLAAGVALAPIGIHLAHRAAPGRRVFFARWGFRHAAMVLAVALVAMFLAGTVAHYAVGERELLPLLYLGESAKLAAVGAALLVARACEPGAFAALGFRRGGNGRALLCGAVSFVFFLPLVHGADQVWPFVYELFGGAWEEQEVITMFASLQGMELVQAILLAVLVAPLLEELLFRGFLQPLLVQNLSDRGGIVLTSLLFALLHGWSAFLPIFVLSLVIGGVMLRTQRIAAAWLVHALNNAITIAVLVLAEGTGA